MLAIPKASSWQKRHRRAGMFFPITWKGLPGCFCSRNQCRIPEMDVVERPRSSLEMEERLLSLELEAQHAIAGLWRFLYREKARSVDEYILHPNLKDIHLVRSCILWMPAGAA